MLMMGLKVLGLWESGRCVLLWSGNSTKALGARTRVTLPQTILQGGDGAAVGVRGW